MRRNMAVLTYALALVAALPAQAEDGLTQPVTCWLAQADSSEEAQAHLAGICTVLRNQPAISTLPIGYQVSLTAELIRPDFLRAHLAWQSESDTGIGPTVDLGFLDTSLSSQHYAFVVTSLLNATNLPSPATNGD
mgnify:CR=1 FL=1